RSRFNQSRPHRLQRICLASRSLASWWPVCSLYFAAFGSPRHRTTSRRTSAWPISDISVDVTDVWNRGWNQPRHVHGFMGFDPSLLQEHRLDIDRRSMADGVEVIGDPAVGDVAPDLLEMQQEVHAGVELAGDAEPAHLVLGFDPVHVDALVLVGS